MDIQVCTGKSCSAKFSNFLIKRYERDAQFYNWDGNVSCSNSLCLGKCETSPNVRIDGKLYTSMNGIKLSQTIISQLKK